MRPVILTFIRLGPSWVYVVAMTLVVSTVLLDYYPASPFVWALYLTVLPVMREPVFMLLSTAGIEAWAVVSALALAAVFGLYISVWQQRFLRIRFIHAHVALIALVFANVRATSAQAGLTALPAAAALVIDADNRFTAWSRVGGSFWFGLSLLTCRDIAIGNKVRKGSEFVLKAVHSSFSRPNLSRKAITFAP